MGKILGSMLVCGVAWLVVYALVQADLTQGRMAIFITLFAVIPPLIVMVTIVEVVKDASAQALAAQVKAGETVRSHALYLRAFEYDVAARTPNDDLGRITHVAENLWRADRSLSALVAELLKRECDIGDVVSVMPPSKGTEGWGEISHGPGRVTPTDGDWQASVLDLCKSAQAIVIAIGSTRGVQWEFEQLQALGRLRSTVLLVPPYLDRTRDRTVARQVLRSWAQTLGAAVPEEFDAGFAITFSDNGSLHHVWPFEISEPAERTGKSQLSLALRHAANVPQPWGSHENPIELRGLLDIALVEKEFGRLDEARAIEERLLHAQRAAFGDEHAETLRTMNNLGVTLRMQGDVRSALAMQRHVVAGMSRVFGSEHLYTLQASENLALCLSDGGDFSGARSMHERAIAGISKTRGAEAQETLTAQENMSCTMIRFGATDGAKQILRQVTDVRTRVLGAHHVETLRGLKHLALAHLASGDIAGAMDRAKALLDGATHAFGTDHPITIEAMNMTADFQQLAAAQR